ncbi:MAG: phosphoglucosamine mutase, partial [Firmicutes bacterium]|nr:phosphoglucosamine mutase [Bacillota bacterium]
HPEKLQKAVVDEGAFMGLAFDGDADRLIAVDEKGRIMDGDKLMCICAEHLKKKGKLPDNKVTATVMSNLGLHKYMESIGCTVDVTGVGDRYVLESMLKTGCVLGGEQSGHIIFLDRTTTGDGTMSALQVMEAVLDSGKKPSELSDAITIYPQVLKNAKVREDKKNKYERDDDIMNAISKVEDEMEGRGRVLIRPSGTEPLVRVMLEGEDVDHITKLAENLAALFEEKLG